MITRPSIRNQGEFDGNLPPNAKRGRLCRMLTTPLHSAVGKWCAGALSFHAGCPGSLERKVDDFLDDSKTPLTTLL